MLKAPSCNRPPRGSHSTVFCAAGFCGSEQELHRELDLARGRSRRGEDPSRGANRITRENHRIGRPEVSVIENVEGFRPKLQTPLLIDAEPLEERGVYVEQARPYKRAARHVPEGPGQRHRERPGIKPMFHIPQNHLPLEVRIPVRRVGRIRVPGPGNFGANHRREGEATLRTDDAIPLPAADELIHPPAGAATEAMAAPERQRIADVSVKLVLEAAGRDSPC